MHVADPVRAQLPIARGGLGRDRRARVLAPGNGLSPGASSRADAGLGIAAPPQVVVEGVKDPGVDRVQPLAAQRGLDLVGD
jgi:hypothetical protein